MTSRVHAVVPQRSARDPARAQVLTEAESARCRRLRTKVELARTMLVAAATTQRAAILARRLAKARATHDYVARHLARSDASGLPAAEWAALAAALTPITAALDALPSERARGADAPRD